LIVWFVDATRSIKRWGDDDWTGHTHLLRLLVDAGFRPRVEHIAREQFPTRWERLDVVGEPPDIITADNLAGLVRELDQKGRLVRVQSERLSWTPEVASCSDFAGRWFLLVKGSRHEAAARKAVAELHRPGPETELPGAPLRVEDGSEEAIAIAGRAAVAFFAGNPKGLKEVASESSPQLTRCTNPGVLWQGREVYADSVEIRGNALIAFAKVEMRFRSKNLIGADPVLVVLRREGGQWKAFAISSDVFSVKALPDLSRLDVRQPTGPEAPHAPRLIFPSDGGALGGDDRSFSWEIPPGGEPSAAQVCQVLLNSDEVPSWPETRLKVYPGEPRLRSLLLSETSRDLTGLSAKEMSWNVWTISKSGRIAVSEVRRYNFRKLDY
jgi:hypothetical protein